MTRFNKSYVMIRNNSKYCAAFMSKFHKITSNNFVLSCLFSYLFFHYRPRTVNITFYRNQCKPEPETNVQPTNYENNQVCVENKLAVYIDYIVLA